MHADHVHVDRSANDLWKPLGSLLVEKGLVKQDALDIALVEHERTGRRLGEVLVDLGVITPAGLTKVLMEQVGVDLSQEGGFGSGLRDELERRTTEDAPPALEAPAPPPSDGVEASEEPSGRSFFRRRKERDPENRLAAAVAQFERQSSAIQESLVELQRLLGEVGEGGYSSRSAAL